MLPSWKVDLCCFQETRWRGVLAHLVRIASISYFGVEIKQVLEVLGKCLLKSGSAMSFMLQDRISVVYS